MRTLLMLGFWSVATPLGALVAVPYALLTGNSDFLYRVSMLIIRGGLWLAGIQVESVGLDQLDPNASYVFMANHVSDLDPPVLMPSIPRRTSVLVKKELFRIPVLGPAMRVARLVPVDRHNREAAIASVRAAAEVIRMGLNMMVYPEGTRSTDGRLLPLKKGPFYLAQEADCGIVPVTILGTYEMKPKGKFFHTPGKATLVFHPPVWPRDYSDRDAVIAAVSDRIASALPQDRR